MCDYPNEIEGEKSCLYVNCLFINKANGSHSVDEFALEISIWQVLKQEFYIGQSCCIICSITILKTDLNKHFCPLCMVLLKMSFPKDLNVDRPWELT